MPLPPNRTMVAAVLLLSALTQTTACLETEGRTVVLAGDPQAPNVVIVVMDTTRADRCSFNGYARPTTPALEALAAEATNFTSAYSPAPWTPPSHASLFTGVRPERHGLRCDSSMELSDKFTTLAEHLRSAGYVTAGYSTNPLVLADFGLDQGFDVFDEVFKEPDIEYPMAPMVLERAYRKARAAHADGKPFFLFTNHLEPHLPYSPSENMQSRFVPAGVSPVLVDSMRTLHYPRAMAHNLGVERITPAELSVLRDLYDAEIAMLDQALGRFVERLRQDGLLDDTLLVITSDHGENLGEHGFLDHMFSVHSTLLHVPLLIRYPRRFQGGRRVDDVVRLEDVFPTVLDVCGLPVPDDLDGASLAGDVSGRTAIGRLGNPSKLLEQAAVSHPRVDTMGYAEVLWSVRNGRNHLIQGEYGDVQLYDVAADPLETNDLTPSRPELVQQLQRLLPAIAR